MPIKIYFTASVRYARTKRSAPKESRCQEGQSAAIWHEANVACLVLPATLSHFADSSRKIIAHHTLVFSFVSYHMPYTCYRHDDTRVRKYESCHTPKSFMHCLAVVLFSSSDVEAFSTFQPYFKKGFSALAPNHPRPLSQRPTFSPILSACAIPTLFLPGCQTSC